MDPRLTRKAKPPEKCEEGGKTKTIMISSKSKPNRGRKPELNAEIKPEYLPANSNIQKTGPRAKPVSDQIHILILTLT